MDLPQSSLERTFVIEYAEKVVERDLPKLSKSWQLRIKTSLEEKLARRPDVYAKPLHGLLTRYYKFRIGDHRAIFKIQGNKIKITILEHRSRVYHMALKRLGLE